jgi:DDE superfamily endonuclease
MGPDDVRLFIDATRLRLFPPLRSVWAQAGKQALVPVTGRKAKRVLFGAINVRTGHRIVVPRQGEGASDVQALFKAVRRCYRHATTIWLLLDEASAHTAIGTQQLAAQLSMQLVWLPKQWPELNAMDQLWRELKRLIAANRQAASIDELTEQAAQWVLGLSKQEALRKTGILSPNFWLRNLLQQFCRPT